MKNKYDTIVIGAGPAGLACGAELARKGLEIAVLDEQAGPGGQIYRNIGNASADQHTLLGPDYSEGRDLVCAFTESPAEYYPGSRVWQADENGDVCLSRGGASGKLHADYLVIATGAMERPVPFPGWTLPGVMTCGGMSNLFKDSGLVPAEPLVVAGSGPLVWLVAEHLLALEAPVAAICDTTPIAQTVTAMKHMPAAMKRFGYMMKGVKMIAGVRKNAMKAKVPVFMNVKGLQAIGEDKLTEVRFTCGSRELSYSVSTLLVSEGIIPNTSLLRQVGCDHEWNPVQRFWHPEVSEDGCTNLPRVFVAGDGGFVHGAKSAEYKGRLAGLAIALEMNRVSKPEYDKQAAPVREALKKELYPRPFIDAMYAPRKDLYTMADDTIVCRCESVTAGRIRDLVEDGLTDHNEIKAIIRCGMGPCQGRMCTSAVNELIVSGAKIAPQDARPHRLRPPIKPVSLQELANATLGGSHES
ncbi:NAD(P)/FAD-dependent oxidoreductase [Desulfopila sp. IMCC35008]|uniref:NAD(P)/FAD-dependent oxidoreductase n=1 Tax=Desulfopila sp. IMCC35008 TaxID=2653858 RepID=UPI0013D63AD0|nr:NAD(P)/FAD-dependent oxidoreductase [Desulfopila sp. IMCC35008]